MKTSAEIIQELESKLRYYQAKSREMENTVHDLRVFIKRMEIQMKSCLEAIADNHREKQKIEEQGPHPIHDMQSFRWQCPQCDGKHLWTWKAYEVAESNGPMLMTCDHCGNDQAMASDGKGNFITFDVWRDAGN